jgi:hypothetical protein
MNPPPVNMNARRAYSLVLRRFHAGRMTNFEYEDRCEEIEKAHGTDSAIWQIFLANWFTYCDIRKHRMTGNRKLDGNTRRFIAQALLLLRTGFEPAPETAEERRGKVRCLTVLLAGLVLVVVLAVVLPLWVSGGLIALCYTTGWAWHGLAMLIRKLRRIPAADAPAPLPDHWPFASASDLAEARSRRVYLCGSAA